MNCAIAVATHPVGQRLGHSLLKGALCPQVVFSRGETLSGRPAGSKALGTFFAMEAFIALSHHWKLSGASLSLYSVNEYPTIGLLESSFVTMTKAFCPSATMETCSKCRAIEYVLLMGLARFVLSLSDCRKPLAIAFSSSSLRCLDDKGSATSRKKKMNIFVLINWYVYVEYLVQYVKKTENSDPKSLWLITVEVSLRPVSES